MVQGKSEFDNQLEEIGKERYINDMELREPKIYGIGNPLIDIIVNISEDGLNKLGIYKGAMHLIDEKRRALLLEHIESLPRTLLCGGSCPNTIITLASFHFFVLPYEVLVINLNYSYLQARKSSFFIYFFITF